MEKIIAFFASVTLFLNYIFGISIPSSTNEVKFVKNDKLVGIQAAFAGQGISADDDFYYTSGSLFIQKTGFGLQYLAKWDAETFKQTKTNLNPLPKEYVDNYGLGHIGGISVCDNILYAAVEGTDSNVNFVFLYNADDLKLIKTYNVSNQYLTSGIPWIAIDKENGFAYSLTWGTKDKLVRFKLSDMSFDGVVTLSQPISRIQGGEFYSGFLYLSGDNAHSNEDIVYKADVTTGEVSEAFRTFLASPDNESEDIAIFPRKDGSLFHILNYDKIIGVNLVHYSPNN